MHVITRKRLNEFAKLYPEVTNALSQWYVLIKQNDFSTFPELREIFPAADQVGKLTVFNIGGNKVRLSSSTLRWLIDLITGENPCLNSKLKF